MKFQNKIAIPEKRGGRPYRYPFRDMKIGDSYLVEDGISQERLGSMLTRIFQNTGMRFTQRIADKGIRVWRIA